MRGGGFFMRKHLCRQTKGSALKTCLWAVSVTDIKQTTLLLCLIITNLKIFLVKIIFDGKNSPSREELPGFVFEHEKSREVYLVVGVSVQAVRHSKFTPNFPNPPHNCYLKRRKRTRAYFYNLKKFGSSHLTRWYFT